MYYQYNRPYIGTDTTLFILLKTVRLPEWSKGPGLGPGIFECVSSNLTADISLFFLFLQYYFHAPDTWIKAWVLFV